MNSFKQALYENIIKNAADYEDGETGLISCVEKYCEEHNVDLAIGYEAYDYYIKKKALAAGIPLSVIEEKKKLSECFSQDYINWKCNIKNDNIS
jgi:hypothetical protein